MHISKCSMHIRFWTKTLTIFLYKFQGMHNNFNYGQNNLFIAKSTFKIIIHVLKLLQKKLLNFKCFTSKRNAHGTFWHFFIEYYSTIGAASWRKRLDARLPPLGSRVRVSVPPCGFRGGRNGVWVGFSRGFFLFPLPQISLHHFSTLISSISFHFISPCDGASGVVGGHPCYSRTYNIGASSHLIPRPDLVLDMSWGYLFHYTGGGQPRTHHVPLEM